MADETDSDPSSPSSSSPDRSRDWYAEQWSRLCEELDTSEPAEALARVQAMKRQLNQAPSSMEAPDEEEEEEEGLVTVSEVEEVFREMNQKIEKLRERNAALAEHLEEEGDEEKEAVRDFYRKTEDLLETLDATTMDEARERIQTLNQRLEELYHEKELLAQSGLSDAEEALDELDRLREERDALRRERDRLQADRNRPEQTPEEPGTPEDPDSASDLDASLLEAVPVIRDQIGVSSPEQVEAFARSVEKLHERVRERAAAVNAELDDAPNDVMEMLHSISAHLDALPAPDALPPAVADVLGVSTPSEAGALAESIHRMRDSLAEHYETLSRFEDVEPEAEDAQTLLRTLEDQLRALPDAPAEDEGLPAEVGDVLGIRTVEDARELESLIADLTDRLERLSEEHEKLDEAGLTVDAALAMIENMEAQLANLYHGSGAQGNGILGQASTGLDALDESLRGRIADLTDADSEAADDVTQVVQTLVNRLDRLADEHEALDEAGLDADEAVAMIESMEVQLDDLYRSRDEQMATADRLAAIEDVLGISTREEAEELSQVARQMEDQLTTLYREKEKLQELGLNSIGDAVDMVENMEDQLTDLYEDREAIRDIEMEVTDEQSTFQQLEALYAERERLQQALGVSSATEIIEMVESLNTQLDELYEQRDAEIDPDERHDALLWEPEAEPPSGDDETTRTLNSMEHQLEALYREKETLLHYGFGNAQEAVSQLQAQQKQLDILQRENHTYEQRFERLQSELGTARVSQIVSLVQALESKTEVSLEDVLDTASAPSENPEYGLDIEAASPFVDEATLDRLDEMSTADLDALDVGIVRLSGNGVVEALNEAALQLPSLSAVEDRTTVIGKNFFLELAPDTNNNLFYGRFQRGRRRGAIDARFPYTFTSPDEAPQSFAVHLYRKPDDEATWLLYRPT